MDADKSNIEKKHVATKSISENKLTSGNSSDVVKYGSIVTLDYTGNLEDGTVFDSSLNHNEPLKFEIGKGMVIKGFESNIMDMQIGDEKTFTLQPEEAYGEKHSQLIQKIPRNKSIEQQEPKPGMYLIVNAPDGQQYPALIIDVDETTISLDFNHPLAGKKLTFKIKIIKIE
ncbi:MAG: peptidylprolyl isomerase [Candidatus Woesearchaeota archaeon]